MQPQQKIKKQKLRNTRSYAISLDKNKFGNGLTDRSESLAKFNEEMTQLFGQMNTNKCYERYIEHFSFDTQDLTLKTEKRSHKRECVLKFEKNVTNKTNQITCKFKSFDLDIVRDFPVSVNPQFNKNNKLETDFHPRFVRFAISLVAKVPEDYTFKVWQDIENIFPGIIAFLGILGTDEVITRLYKVKYEVCNQILILNKKKVIGRISLEYPSFEEATSHNNMFHGEWVFRIKENKALFEDCYDVYYSKIIKSEWSYEKPITNQLK